MYIQKMEILGLQNILLKMFMLLQSKLIDRIKRILLENKLIRRIQGNMKKIKKETKVKTIP